MCVCLLGTSENNKFFYFISFFTRNLNFLHMFIFPRLILTKSHRETFKNHPKPKYFELFVETSIFNAEPRRTTISATTQNCKHS